ncbi:MAG: HAMP domain-containing protein [Chloroflexi bacterium]|nr:HAMP domain-containing protein [Chloroflexota bacterium]
MFNSLRVRLTVLFVVLTIVPLVLVAAAIAYEGSDRLQEQTVEFQEYLAQNTAIRLSAFFQERQNELVVLTQVYGLEYLDENTQRDVLLTLLGSQSAYYKLTLVDPEGQETLQLVRGEVITDEKLASRTDDALFQSAIETQTINFSPVHFDDVARDHLITVAVPVEDLFTGKTSYVLMADLRFQNVQEAVMRELNLTEGEDVYVVDSGGIVVAHRNPNLIIRETVFTPPASAGRYTGLSDTDVILAMDTIRLANLELTVIAEKSYAAATALASDLTKLAATITAISLAIAGAIVILMVSRVVKPIAKVARVAQAVQAGNLSARADETGSNELATLGRSFNAMTNQLQQTLLGLQENVTKLEEANQQREALIKDLQAAKRLAEENSRLKSEFLSTMSHELRTPMNAIEGFTSIMLKRMAGVDYNEKAERYLNKVQSNSQRLLHLINDFLDLSRIESGRMELAELPISPAAMMQRWENELGILVNGKDIQFEAHLDPDLPETIYGDEEALSKIAANLLGNAFKFTAEGRVTLSLELRGDQLALQVSDTGIGIPPHAREFIFDEFRQVDQSSKRQYGGTGLGLAIVQKLAREMGGMVTLESEVGKGSTFTVLVPIQAEKQYA